MNEYDKSKNPYQKYVLNKGKEKDRNYGKPDYHQQRLSFDSSSRPKESQDAIKWKQVKQVYEDCIALGWDEEDTAEALLGIVEDLLK